MCSFTFSYGYSKVEQATSSDNLYYTKERNSKVQVWAKIWVLGEMISIKIMKIGAVVRSTLHFTASSALYRTSVVKFVRLNDCLRLSSSALTYHPQKHYPHPAPQEMSTKFIVTRTKIIWNDKASVNHNRPIPRVFLELLKLIVNSKRLLRV